MHATVKQMTLRMVYIDYKKAHDSVPHSHSLKVLQLYKVDVNVIRLMQHTMGNKSLKFTDGTAGLRSRTPEIWRGIFLAMNLLNRALNQCKDVYHLNYVIRNT